MGTYTVVLKDNAVKDLSIHKRAGDKKTLQKISKIIAELEVNPYEGIGKPEALKYELIGFWSRRINSKDRIIYSVNENIVSVEVVSAKGHYFDK